jgi:hypothetical protein
LTPKHVVSFLANIKTNGSTDSKPDSLILLRIRPGTAQSAQNERALSWCYLAV